MKDPYEKALSYTYRLLNIRPRSAKEIQDKLKKRGFPGRLINRVSNQLKKEGQIDDLKFAKLWIENRMAFNPKGFMALGYELKEKGLKPDVIESAIDGAKVEFNEYEIARQLTSGMADRKKIYSFLKRRGFEFDLIDRILEELDDV